jgi:ATP-dependent DNA helicase RecG
MMNAKIQKLLRDGEGLTVEFKRCRDKLSQTVYETVCALQNRA